MNKNEIAVVIVTRNRVEPLVRCLETVYTSQPKISQVIVVNNNSSDETIQVVKKKYPGVILLNQKINTGAARGRNIGASAAKTKFIFFLDDDAYVNKNTINNCLKCIKDDSRIAIVQTKVLSSFNKKKILGIAHDINTTTSLITAFGINEIDKGQYKTVIDVPMVGTGWLVKKSIFDEINGFDEKFFVPYEDSDISLRVREAGYRIVFDPTAEIWHDDIKPTEINPRIRSIGIASPERAFFVGRNKVYFMRKHSHGLSRFVFFVFLLPLFISYHSFIILTSLRPDIFITYIKGLISGFTL